MVPKSYIFVKLLILFTAFLFVYIFVYVFCHLSYAILRDPNIISFLIDYLLAFTYR